MYIGIEIKEAYPCKSLNTGHNEVNVEMDPSSAFEVRQTIEQKNMKVVGWYHSHPTFLPDPSLIDIENQYNYQRLSQDKYIIEPAESTEPTITTTETETKATSEAETIPNNTITTTANNDKNNNNLDSSKDEPKKTITLEPFVGAIVTPYDPDLKTSASAINWFYVSDNDSTSGKVPKRLAYEIIDSNNLSVEEEQRMVKYINK